MYFENCRDSSTQRVVAAGPPDNLQGDGKCWMLRGMCPNVKGDGRTVGWSWYSVTLYLHLSTWPHHDIRCSGHHQPGHAVLTREGQAGRQGRILLYSLWSISLNKGMFKDFAFSVYLQQPTLPPSTIPVWLSSSWLLSMWPRNRTTLLQLRFQSNLFVGAMLVTSTLLWLCSHTPQTNM